MQKQRTKKNIQTWKGEVKVDSSIPNSYTSDFSKGFQASDIQWGAHLTLTSLEWFRVIPETTQFLETIYAKLKFGRTMNEICLSVE